MNLPPGIIYLSKLSPGLFAPPLATFLLKWLSETYLGFHVPRTVFAPLCLLSFPLVFVVKVQYSLYSDRRAAAAHGAVLPPTLPSSIGGIDLVLASMRNLATNYPGEFQLLLLFPCTNVESGEPLALLAKKHGHTFSMRVLFEDRVRHHSPRPRASRRWISDLAPVLHHRARIFEGEPAPILLLYRLT